jgi:hypothetical protein
MPRQGAPLEYGCWHRNPLSHRLSRCPDFWSLRRQILRARFAERKMSATTKVDSQNLFSLVNRDNALTVFPNRLALNVNEFIGALVSQNKPNSKLP